MLQGKLFSKKDKKGQSTVEYLLLVAAIITVLILFLKPDGPFAKSYNDALTKGSSGMEQMANRLSDSRTEQVTNPGP